MNERLSPVTRRVAGEIFQQVRADPMTVQSVRFAAACLCELQGLIENLQRSIGTDDPAFRGDQVLLQRCLDLACSADTALTDRQVVTLRELVRDLRGIGGSKEFGRDADLSAGGGAGQ
jgi:hypothetical protein